MLHSPENFHLNKSLFSRLLNKLSFGKFEQLNEKIRLKQHMPKGKLLEFYVDWDSKDFNRIALVNELIRRSKDQNGLSYLEIGCAGNKLFQSVHSERKIGVDPFAGGTHRVTSDEFFSQNSQRFNVIFVDGLHEYQQIRRDVENALNNVVVGGYIALHDMLPRNWIEAHVPCIRQGPWTGDVWKIAFDLINTKGIEFDVLNIDYGVGVIKKCKNKINLYKSQELGDEGYTYYSNNRHKLPIIEYETFINY